MENNNFKHQLRVSLLTVIVAAFSFLMALSWRETIQEYLDLAGLTSAENKLVGSLIITVISVAGILIATKFLSEVKK